MRFLDLTRMLALCVIFITIRGISYFFQDISCCIFLKTANAILYAVSQLNRRIETILKLVDFFGDRYDH